MTAAASPALRGRFTAASAEIGRRIWREAVWYRGRCNWVGAEPLERDDGNRLVPTTYRSLGPDLYSGTSGVALFLGELAAVTGEACARRAARGAIRHALAHADDVPVPSRLGLFTGWTGIAVAAARLGVLLGEPEWQQRGLALAHRCAREPVPTAYFDVVSGRAGAIAGFLLLSRIAGQDALLDVAVRLADELVESAVPDDHGGCSWASPDVRTVHDLTGFSHGAAGAAYALGEVFAVTGDRRYRQAADLAFRYEERWFSPQQGNWPDFREDPFGPRRTRGRPLRFATFWCHGAPGGAMSRLRAYQQLGDQARHDEAIAALRTTRNSVRAAVESGAWNYSLCHGLSGNAEALLEASRMVDTDSGENAEVCDAVASQGLQRHALAGSGWPCGTHTGETPNLMLGLAGIGLFYLRLENRSVPSVLLPRPENAGRT